MIFLLIFIELLIISTSLSIITDKKISITFPLSIILITLCEYIFGILSYLSYASCIINILTIASFIHILIFIYKYSLTNLKKYFDTSVIALIIMYGVSVVFLQERVISRRDELTFWAILPKTMLIENHLPKFGSNMVITGYTPFTGLWSYWFCNHFNNFYDGLIFISNALLQLSLTVSVIYQFKTKYKFITSFAAIFLFYLIADYSYNYIYVETPIALLFSFALLFWINNEKSTKNTIIMALIASSLFLIKSTAIIFSAAILINIFISAKNEKKYKNFIIALIILISFKLSWTLYLNVNHLCLPYDTTTLNIKNIINYFSGLNPSYQYKIPKDMLLYLINNHYALVKYINIKIPCFILYAFTLIYIFCVYNIKKERQLKTILFNLIFLYCSYFLALIIMFQFCFSQWEIAEFAGLQRYIQLLNIISAAMLFYVYISYDMFKKTNHNTEKYIKTSLIIIILSFCISEYNEKIFKYKDINKRTINAIKRNEYIKSYKNILTKEDKILLITDKVNSQHVTREQQLHQSRYEIVPYRIYMFNDTLTTKEQIIDKLACGYTYIFFWDSEEKLLEQFQFLSDRKLVTNKIYKVEKINDDEFKLIGN